MFLGRVFNCLSIILWLLISSCEPSVEQLKKQAENDLLLGEEIAQPIKDLFNKGQLEPISATFLEISKNPKVNPVMKLVGYSFVFYSFERRKMYDSALMYQDSCISVIENNKLEKVLPVQYAGYLLAKSLSLFQLHNSDQANALFYKAKNIDNRYFNSAQQFDIAEKLAHVAYQQHSYDEASRSFKETLLLHRQLDSLNYYKEAELLSNIGLCFYHLGNYANSISLYFDALKVIDIHRYNIAHYIKDSSESLKAYATSKGVLLGNIAKAYQGLGQLDSAIFLSKESIHLNSTLYGERRDAQRVASRLVDLYIQKKQWNNAHLVMEKIKYSQNELPDEQVRLDWFRQASILAEQKNQIPQAFYLFKEYSRIKDSINEYEKKDAANNIIKDLEIRTQQADLALLKKDNQLNRLYLSAVLIGLFTSVIVIVLVVLNYKRTRQNNRTLAQLNQEINLQKQELEQLNATKDRIMNIVAHDLRNPIGAIANFLDIIQVKFEHSDAESKILNSSQQAANRSLHLINDLLEVNKLQSGELDLRNTEIDLVQLINLAIDEVAYKAVPKEQHIQFMKSVDRVLIEADEEKLKRVVVNLLDNAIKFSYIKSTIQVILFQESNFVQLKVSDTGIGIPENVLPYLFKEGITFKRKGTNNELSNGLGLAICKKIIEAHRGKILVESKPGDGTTFMVQIPLVTIS